MNKKIWFVVVAFVSLIFTLVARINPNIIDYYRKYGLVPFIASIYSRLTGLLPFSCAEFLIYGLVISFAFYFLFFVYSVIARKDRKKYVINVLWNVIAFLSVIATLFLLLCGVYYKRKGVNEYIGFELIKYDANDLYETELHILEEIDKIDEKIFVIEEYDFDKMSKETVDIYKQFGKKYSAFSYVYGKPKPVFMSKQMSYLGIVGIFMPFTMEANVNKDVPLYTIPSSMCHEMAHMYGFMKEDEANYLAYKVCVESDNDLFRLSGLTMQLMMCQNELFLRDYDKFEKIEEIIPKKLGNLFAKNNEYWEKIEETEVGNTVVEDIMDASEEVNDFYLKANGEENGVESYDMVVGLIVSEYLNDKNN